MKEFILFIRGKKDFPASTPEEFEKRMAPYNEWMQNLVSKGRFKEGSPLVDDRGKMVDGKNQSSEGSFLDPKTVISGYLIIYAKDLNEAADIAQACPMSKHFPIEVREVKVRK